MGILSKITWTDATWNPWMGCTKITAGCKDCYMFRLLKELALKVRKTATMNKPLTWKKSKMIFTCSMSDFFIEEADEWRKEAWNVIKKSQQHTYLILTKRPERIKECLPNDWCKENYSNVWLGVTVENNESKKRIHELAKIPCELKWVSFEPLLEGVYLNEKELSIIDWAIIGGESGVKARKSELPWFLSLMYQFRNVKKPVFFKQFGTWYSKNELKLKDWKGEKWCSKFPEEFKVRQIPNNYER